MPQRTSEGWKRMFPSASFPTAPARVKSIRGLLEWVPLFPHKTRPSHIPCPSRVFTSKLTERCHQKPLQSYFPSSQLRDGEFLFTNGGKKRHRNSLLAPLQIQPDLSSDIEGCNSQKIPSPRDSKSNKFQDASCMSLLQEEHLFPMEWGDIL